MENRFTWWDGLKLTGGKGEAIHSFNWTMQHPFGDL
jgi:hypothetical protein